MKQSLFNQWKRLEGITGQLLVRLLNFTHKICIKWAFSKLTFPEHIKILDIGYGGGWTLKYLSSKLKNTELSGMDYSKTSVRTTFKMNRKDVSTGKISVFEGSVSNIPFKNNFFDAAAAINSHYYWPDLKNDLTETLRVLKNNGRLVIIGESYKGSRFDKRNEQFITANQINNLTINELYNNTHRSCLCYNPVFCKL